MKTLFLIISLFISSVASATETAKVDFVGAFSLTGLEMKAVAVEVEKAAPGCEVELTLLPPGEYKNITSVKYVVLHNGEMYSGVAAGFNQLDATRMAVADLRDEVRWRTDPRCQTYNNYETVCED